MHSSYLMPNLSWHLKKECINDGDPSFREKVNKDKNRDLNLLKDYLVIKDFTAVKDDIVMRFCN